MFRSRILLHDADERLFRRVVRRAVEAGVLPRRSLQARLTATLANFERLLVLDGLAGEQPARQAA